MICKSKPGYGRCHPATAKKVQQGRQAGWCQFGIENESPAQVKLLLKSDFVSVLQNDERFTDSL
jgi:hypothetical protein